MRHVWRCPLSQDSSAEVRELIERKYRLAQGGDYHALLGVPPTAAPADVKKAYFSLAKQVHPDRLGRLGLDDLRSQATRLFNVLTQAFDTLTDPKRLAEYKAGRLRAATPTRPAFRDPSVNSDELAKIAFHKGGVMMTKRAWGDAERCYRQATNSAPDNARYWQSLGWAIISNVDEREDTPRLEEARKCYEKALELDESDAQTHYCVALYWKERSKKTRAKRALEKALECKPDFIEAKRELRLMEMRQKRRGGATTAAPKKRKAATTSPQASGSVKVSTAAEGRATSSNGSKPSADDGPKSDSIWDKIKHELTKKR